VGSFGTLSDTMVRPEVTASTDSCSSWSWLTITSEDASASPFANISIVA